MANDSSDGEKFFQHDENLAHDAANTLNDSLLDPKSLASRMIGDQSFQTGFLEMAEKKALDERGNLALRELGILSRQEMEAWAIREAQKITGKRPGAVEGFAIFFGDINGMKAINDSQAPNQDRGNNLVQGHELADRYVIDALLALKKSVRSGSDVVGRPNERGDEMMAMCPMSDGSTAKHIMEESRSEVPAIIPTLVSKIDELRRAYKSSYPAWPADTENKHPGKLSYGWYYISSVIYEEYYKMFLNSKEPGKSFLNILSRHAEQDMYEMKRRIK